MVTQRILNSAFTRPLRGWLLAALLGSAAAERSGSAECRNPAIDPQAFFAAIVTVQARALPDARSAATLGTERAGTGMVIGKGGLILTIGYLIVEADDVRDHR